MNKHLSRAIATCGCALALCLGLAACGSTAATGDAPGSSGITVNASSKVSLVPDVCSFTVTVTAMGDSAAEAQRAAAKPVKDVIKQLRDLGVAEKDIQTTYTDTSPYWNDEGQTDQYESRTIMQVDNVPVDEVGSFMQAATDAGATEVGSLQYSASSYEEAYQQALEQAVEAAKPKAEAIAKASGVRLGKVVSVSEGYQDVTFANLDGVALAKSEEETDAGGIDIAPGQVSIEAQVTITYAIN